MNIVYNIMVFLHIVGAAMIVGIWIGNMKKPTVHPRQFDGAALQLITGIVMMGLIPALDMDANYFKLGIKFAIALAVGVLAFIGRRKYKKGEADQQGPGPQRRRPGAAERGHRHPLELTRLALIRRRRRSPRGDAPPSSCVTVSRTAGVWRAVTIL